MGSVSIWTCALMSATAVLLVSAAALVPGVAQGRSGSGQSQQTGHGSPAPWCTVSDLRISADWTVEAGTRAGGVLFAARPGVVCRLEGRPGIDLYLTSRLYPGGQRLDVKQHPMPAPSGATNPVGAAVEVRSGHPAGARLAWANWCGRPVLFPVMLRVAVPPGGGRTFIYVRSGSDPRSANVPWCTNRRYPSEFFVGNVRSVTPTNPLPSVRAGRISAMSQ